MTAPIAPRTTQAPPSRTDGAASQDFNAQAPTLDPNFKASEHLDANGNLTLDDSTMPPGYGSYVMSMGETHGKAILDRVSKKMGEWVKNNPNATNEQFTAELKKQLQMQSLVQNELKNSLQKFMNDLFGKMKEMASDRFG
jgi:hypothetical protein